MSKPVVLITGALTGIGRATALAFADEGARVVVSGRREEEGRNLAVELRMRGVEAEFFKADIRYEDDVRRLIDQTISRFGHLDIAVNNAGTEGDLGQLVDQTAESYAATFDTNVLGVLLSMKHELRIMLEQKRGSIVNISSIVGSRAMAGASVYSASKAAVEAFTKAAAIEVATSGIRVNAVAPGPIDTGMLNRFVGDEDTKAQIISLVPLGRIGQPEDIAKAIVFLASERSSFITGQILAADGGRLAA